MGRLFGYMANRADLLLAVIEQESALLAPPTEPVAGWGVGFYQGGEVLHKKRPLLGGGVVDWRQLAENVRSDCIVVHLRQATVGDFRAENTHPFRMGSWIFAHKGTIDRFDAIRERLVEQMPDFLRRNIRGQTDSEHFFHLLLSFLHDAGQLDNPDPDDRLMLSAFRASLALVDRLSAEVGARPGTFGLLLTNGRTMFALRRGVPMCYVESQGPGPAPEGASRAPVGSAFRYVLVVANGGPTTRVSREIPEGSVCIVHRSLEITVQSL